MSCKLKIADKELVTEFYEYQGFYYLHKWEAHDFGSVF